MLLSKDFYQLTGLAGGIIVLKEDNKRILTNHLMFANDFLKIWSPYWSETKSVVWDNLKTIGKMTNCFVTI